MKNPIVIDPPGFDQDAAWKECRDHVEKCGGIATDDGEVNWRAAFGADPGCCSCPACGEFYWAWGRKQRCASCGFEYETDWWPMYSYGCGDARRLNGSLAGPDRETNERLIRYTREQADRRMSHPYYRYGFEHPVADPWEEKGRIDWRAVMSAPSTP